MMSIQFTPKAFTDQFFAEFTKAMEPVQGRAQHLGDELLLLLLSGRFSNEIREHFMSCAEYVNGLRSYADGRAFHEVFGPDFHSGFRKWGVVQTPGVDAIVWKCIASSKDCPAFWGSLAETCDAFFGRRAGDVPDAGRQPTDFSGCVQ